MPSSSFTKCLHQNVPAAGLNHKEMHFKRLQRLTRVGVNKRRISSHQLIATFPSVCVSREGLHEVSRKKTDRCQREEKEEELAAAILTGGGAEPEAKKAKQEPMGATTKPLHLPS